MKKPDTQPDFALLRRYLVQESKIEIGYNRQNNKFLSQPSSQIIDGSSKKILASIDKNVSYRQAAVLLLIYPGLDELEIILTRRAEHLSHHAGQICLPGGTVDTNDESLIDTALRETDEEIGLNSQLVEVLGTLDISYTPSGFAITPIVGLLKERPELLANSAEVAQIVSIPLRLVLTLSCYQRDFLIREGIKREFYYIEYEGLNVWGATATILHSLACKIRD